MVKEFYESVKNEKIDWNIVSAFSRDVADNICINVCDKSKYEGSAISFSDEGIVAEKFYYFIGGSVDGVDDIDYGTLLYHLLVLHENGDIEKFDTLLDEILSDDESYDDFMDEQYE